MNPQYLVLLAVAFIMGWYALGTIYNVRRGELIVRWMRGGLPHLGDKTTYRWLGSSVIEMVIEHARTPAKRAEVLTVLAPRDVPWAWLIARARGRRDIFILRLDLSAAPRQALELADPITWTGRMAIQDAQSQGWESRDHGDKILLAPTGLLNLAVEDLERATAARALPMGFHRFGLRKDPARLEIHLPVPNLKITDADEFFSAIRALAQAVSRSA